MILERGWNLVSTFIVPFDSEVTHLLADIQERENLRIMKNVFGDFWWPQYNYNGLGNWDFHQGYLICVEEADEFYVNGERTPPDTPIDLRIGWNMISYFLDRPVDCEIALSGVVDQLGLAKDGWGRFYAPEFGYNGLGDMVAGRGYKLKMLQRQQLIYNADDEVGLMRHKGGNCLDYLTSTGIDMSLLVTEIDGIENTENVEIRIIGEMGSGQVGGGLIDQIPCGIIIRGDDETSDIIEGALQDEPLLIELITSGRTYKPQIETVAGELRFTTDGFSVIKLNLDNITLPTDYVIDKIYPNPFNQRTNLRFGLPEDTKVELLVMDLNGRRVYRSPSRHLQAGWHSYNFDAVSWSSGIYIVELITENARISKKLVLLR